ncbi:hypothetical protein Tco_1228283 [Tanacetum coccineum]
MRWLGLLKDYDTNIQYIRVSNLVADALSRKSGLIRGIKWRRDYSCNFEVWISNYVVRGHGGFLGFVKYEGSERVFAWMTMAFLWQSAKLCVPEDPTLREALMTEVYKSWGTGSSLEAFHPGDRTYSREQYDSNIRVICFVLCLEWAGNLVGLYCIVGVCPTITVGIRALNALLSGCCIVGNVVCRQAGKAKEDQTRRRVTPTDIETLVFSQIVRIYITRKDPESFIGRQDRVMRTNDPFCPNPLEESSRRGSYLESEEYIRTSFIFSSMIWYYVLFSRTMDVTHEHPVVTIFSLRSDFHAASRLFHVTRFYFKFGHYYAGAYG